MGMVEESTALPTLEARKAREGGLGRVKALVGPARASRPER